MSQSEKLLRYALDVVTEGPRAAVPRAQIMRTIGPEEFAAESLQTRDEVRPWLDSESVQAIGLGEKITEGRKLETLALRVYVERKLPEAALAAPVPKVMHIPAVGDVVTDVVEIGRIEPETYTSRARPIMPGCGLGHLRVNVGTFGCVVRKRDGGPERYVLSNSHVLAWSGLATVGDVIIQPGAYDGGAQPDDIVAQLSDFVPFDYAETGAPNVVDAAIARILLSGADTRRELRILEVAPQGVSTRLRRGMKVHKVGRTTDHTWGEILDLDARPVIPYQNPANPDDRYDKVPVRFRDQVLCTRYTAGGDSGSIVLSEYDNAVGLHFAGSPSSSLFNKIENVFDALDIELDL